MKRQLLHLHTSQINTYTYGHSYIDSYCNASADTYRCAVRERHTNTATDVYTASYLDQQTEIGVCGNYATSQCAMCTTMLVGDHTRTNHC